MHIIPLLTMSQTFIINKEEANRLAINEMKIAYLKFGNNTSEVKLGISPELKENELLLSINTIDELKLALFLRYELVVNKNEIQLGPFIGILGTKTKEMLDKNVQSYKNFTYDYNHIKGAILAFSLEGIHKKSNQVEGYLYHPDKEQWIKGIYPFPMAVFKRIGIKKEWRIYFNRQTNNRVFNDRIIGKWRVYTLLERNELIKPHLPETVLYQRPKDVRMFLMIFPSVFIKHTFGSQGKGIIEISRHGKWYITRIVGQETVVLKSDSELNTFLKENIIAGEYIVQEAIDLLTIESQKIDFRLMTVKDVNGRWNVLGTIARFGTKDNIISNVSGGGIAEMGYHAIKQTLNLSHKQTYHIIRKMGTLAVELADCLDKSSYLCGNLGIDLALDKKGHIWIIEVNNKDPNHTIALDAGNRHLLYEAKQAAMLYAKKLCGFS